MQLFPPLQRHLYRYATTTSSPSSIILRPITPKHQFTTTTTTTTITGTRTTPKVLQQQQQQQQHPHQQKRTFISSFFPPSNNNNNSNPNSASRTLTATRTLAYPPSALFSIISSVESYSQFLPFLTASTVTHRDPKTGYPTRAFLTVGYGPLSETFTSKVDCDAEKWIVEARSGAKFGVDSKQGQTATASSGGIFPGANEGIFEYLSTRWELIPMRQEQQQRNLGSEKTVVNLEIRFEFKNQWHAAMMSAVEGQMAGVMIEAFEKRIKEIHG